MIDLRTLQERTQAAKPDIRTKSSHYVVAVLKIGIGREDASTQDQYLWLKCRGQHTVDLVYRKYLQKFCTPDDAFILRYQDNLINKDTRICDLDVYEDHLIVFEAMADTAEPPQSPGSPPTAVAKKPEKQRQSPLQTLLKTLQPEVLELGVEEGVKMIDQLRAYMTANMASNPDAEQSIKQLDILQDQAGKPRTVIGVVGSTGAGKSSVINAILDEERLVPTNCMRACTAVVTEIAYNNQDIPYRGLIEFIQPSDWEAELKLLFQDLLDSNGKISNEYVKEDTDTGIAYAKIRAVYPNKSRDDIIRSDFQSMLQEVTHVLGSTREIGESDASQFYKRLQQFIDSQEKTANDTSRQRKNVTKKMEFWPLIKVVRLYVKSPALATGAVIVDLPGVSDSNAARAAVADSYVKQTTGLWIVAPINRAVDDKAAKNLLGESFKRQLKMDGGLGAVTFICSKTDDISCTEAQETLGLDAQLTPLWERLDELLETHEKLQTTFDDLKQLKSVYNEAANGIDDELDVWEALMNDVNAGKEVFAPKPRSSKKRGGTDRNFPRKRLRTSGEAGVGSDVESQNSESNDNTSSNDTMQVIAHGQPLTIEQIMSKIAELRVERKGARQSISDLENRTEAILMEQSQAREASESIDAEITAACIRARNEYSKRAIQQDFAAGVKELDQELAAEEDEENFDPEDEYRDYDQVARELP
ncbi:MAG: hypothetical protein Q9181_006531, partial [Wetmoreana brouardii]